MQLSFNPCFVEVQINSCSGPKQQGEQESICPPPGFCESPIFPMFCPPWNVRDISSRKKLARLPPLDLDHYLGPEKPDETLNSKDNLFQGKQVCSQDSQKVGSVEPGISVAGLSCISTTIFEISSKYTLIQNGKFPAITVFRSRSRSLRVVFFFLDSHD